MSQGIYVLNLICPGKSEKIKMDNNTWKLTTLEKIYNIVE